MKLRTEMPDLHAGWVLRILLHLLGAATSCGAAVKSPSGAQTRVRVNPGCICGVSARRLMSDPAGRFLR